MNPLYLPDPIGWSRTRLRFTIDGSQNGTWGSEPGSSEVDVICVRVADFDWNHLRVSLDDPTVRSIEARQLSKLRIRKGDILLEKSGGGERTPVGRVVRWDSDTTAVTSNFVARMRPASQTSSRFLTYLFASLYLSGFSHQFIKQNTGIQNLDDSSLLDSSVYVPDLATQKAIADFLDRETARIDQLIEKKQRLVELLEEKRSTLIESIVLGGKVSNSENAFPWLRFMPDHWTATPLQYLVKTRGGSTPSKEREDYWIGGDIPWVSPKDMKRDVLFDSEDHITERAVEESAVAYIDPGAVLIVTRGMILAHSVPVARLGIRATINQDMKALIPIRIDGSYLLRLLQGLKGVLLSFIEEAAHGTKKLRTDRLFKTPFPVPPMHEQIELANKIDEFEKSLLRAMAPITRSLSLLQEQRSSLITAAVTGQLDISAWSNRGEAERRLDVVEAAV